MKQRAVIHPTAFEARKTPKNSKPPATSISMPPKPGVFRDLMPPKSPTPSGITEKIKMSIRTPVPASADTEPTAAPQAIEQIMPGIPVINPTRESANGTRLASCTLGTVAACCWFSMLIWIGLPETTSRLIALFRLTATVLACLRLGEDFFFRHSNSLRLTVGGHICNNAIIPPRKN